MRLQRAMLAAFVAGIACGQDAQLSGLIQDPSEAAVLGAEITLRNDQTGGRRATRTNENGLYSLPTLKPGLYRITVRAPGFETTVREGIELQIGENARIDLILHIGDSQTTIVVTGGAPLTNQEDASVGTVVDRNLIDRLPLNGRGIQALIELTPGVLTVPVVDASRGQFVINGQRADANYFTVDGVSANFDFGDPRTLNAISRLAAIPTLGQAGGGMLPANNFLGTFSNLLSPAALQEFKIQTSTYAPEFGHLPGGQIDLISRSGSSRFSGSLFEYFRNDKTDANDWFNNANGAPRDLLRFNNFGLTLGGPLRLPHLYRHDSDGSDRTFFFFSMDELVIRQPVPGLEQGVPPLSVRQNAPPALAALLNAFPLPTPGLAADPLYVSPGLAPYLGSATRAYHQDAYSLRLDRNLNQNLSLFGRYNHAPSSRVEPTVGEGIPANLEHYHIDSDTLTVGLTHVVTPALVNELRANYSRESAIDWSDLDGSGGARQPPDSQLFPTGFSSSDSNIYFALTGTNFAYLGFNAQNRSRQYQFVDNFSWAKGVHQLRFGADYRRFSIFRRDPKVNTIANSAIYNPDGTFASNASSWTTQVLLDNEIEYLVPSFSAYAQDTWRLNRRLTLTWGLRWEVDPAPRTTKGVALALGGLGDDITDGSKSYLIPPGKPFYHTPWADVAPRFGLGWQLFDRAGKSTVLRAGAGRFFSTAQGGFEDSSRGREIYEIYGARQLGPPDPQQATLTFQFDQPYAVAAPRGYDLPSTYQWNVTLEQAMGRQTFSAGYIGALGRGLIGDVWLFPAHAGYDVHVIGNDGSSSYHALQLQFNRRLAGCLQILTSYTWSHSIDDLSSDTSSTASTSRPLSAYLNPASNHASSDFDVRHSINSAVIVELPGPRAGVLAALLRNWRANSIFFARSALPTDVFTLNSGNGRPDSIAGQPLYLYGSQYPGGKRYNPAAVATISDGHDGTLGRNVLRGFGAWQIDFALHREVRLWEHASIEFRAEAFNILNHPNFANPDDAGKFNTVTLNSARNFGLSTSMLANGLSSALVPGELNSLFQIGGPRIMQLALRLNF